MSTSISNAKVKKTKTNKKFIVGALAQVKGSVWLNGFPAKTGAAITPDSEIVTGPDGTVMVLIGEGMVAAIGYNTLAQVESFEKPVTKIRKSKSVIKNELAQVNLRMGSLRMLVRKDSDTVRLATVRAGDAFGIVKDGEALFTCDLECAKKSYVADANNTKATK